MIISMLSVIAFTSTGQHTVSKYLCKGNRGKNENENRCLRSQRIIAGNPIMKCVYILYALFVFMV